MGSLHKDRSPKLIKILNKPFGFFVKFGLILVVVFIVAALSFCLSRNEFMRQKIYCYHSVVNSSESAGLVCFYTHQQLPRWVKVIKEVEWQEATTSIKGNVVSISSNESGYVIAVKIKVKKNINPKKGYLVFCKDQSY